VAMCIRLLTNPFSPLLQQCFSMQMRCIWPD